MATPSDSPGASQYNGGTDMGAKKVAMSSGGTTDTKADGGMGTMSGSPVAEPLGNRKVITSSPEKLGNKNATPDVAAPMTWEADKNDD